MSYQPFDSEEKPIPRRSWRWLWAGIISGAACTGLVFLNEFTLEKSEVLRDLTFWPVYIACVYIAFGPSTKVSLLNIIATAI